MQLPMMMKMMMTTPVFGLVDSNTVSIAKGALVSIDEGVNDTIGALYLDGMKAVAGTWGSRASEAQYRWDKYFSGKGVFTVTGPWERTDLLILFRFERVHDC